MPKWYHCWSVLAQQLPSQGLRCDCSCCQDQNVTKRASARVELTPDQQLRVFPPVISYIITLPTSSSPWQQPNTLQTAGAADLLVYVQCDAIRPACEAASGLAASRHVCSNPTELMGRVAFLIQPVTDPLQRKVRQMQQSCRAQKSHQVTPWGLDDPAYPNIIILSPKRERRGAMRSSCMCPSRI